MQALIFSMKINCLLRTLLHTLKHNRRHQRLSKKPQKKRAVALLFQTISNFLKNLATSIVKRQLSQKTYPKTAGIKQ